MLKLVAVGFLSQTLPLSMPSLEAPSAEAVRRKSARYLVLFF